MRARPSSPLRRVRLFVARHPAVYWLLVASLAGGAAGVVLQRVAAADAARAAWSPGRAVLVATRDLAAGHILAAGDTRVADWPAALLPSDALTTDPGPLVVTALIAAGEPLVRERLDRGPLGPVAAALPAGTRGISLPAGEPPLPLRAGDHVDLVGTTANAPGATVATDGTVISADEQAVVVAVSVDDLPAVAAALAEGAVVLAVRGQRAA